jgi:hypothetical protein
VKRLEPTTLDVRHAACTLDARSLPVGAYRVRFALKACDGTPRGDAQTYFSRVETLPKRRAFIDAHRRLIVDGQPFFPLGMYWSGIKEKECDLYPRGLSTASCRTAVRRPIRWTPASARPQSDLLDKDYFSGTRWAPAHMKTEADETAEIQRRVALHGKHPALIAWYINDE